MTLFNPNYRLSMIHPHRGGLISWFLLHHFSSFSSSYKSVNLQLVEATLEESFITLLESKSHHDAEFELALSSYLQCFMILYQNRRFENHLCVRLLNQFILLSKWAMNIKYPSHCNSKSEINKMTKDFTDLSYKVGLQIDYSTSIPFPHLLCFLDGICCIYIKLFTRIIPLPGFTGDADFVVVMHNGTIYMLEMHLLSNLIICYDCVPVYYLFNKMFRYKIKITSEKELKKMDEEEEERIIILDDIETYII